MQPEKSSSSSRDLKGRCNAAARGSLDSYNHLQAKIRRVKENGYEDATEDDIINLSYGVNEQHTTETTNPNTASTSVSNHTGTISQALRTATHKDGAALRPGPPRTPRLVRRDSGHWPIVLNAEQSRAPPEPVPSILTPRRAQGDDICETPGGFCQGLALAKANDSPLDRLSRTPLNVCNICHFPASSDSKGLSPLLRYLYKPEHPSTEFHSLPPPSTLCCSTTICDDCYVTCISVSLTGDFWLSLDCKYWLRCPSMNCSSRYKVAVPNLFVSTLPDTLAPQVFDHLARYSRAHRYREALRALLPIPTESALRRAAELHEQLALHGRMKNPTDPRQPLSTRIRVLPVDSTDGSCMLQVPIFVDLVVPSQTGGRDCIICAETLSDITDGTPVDEARWATAISGFPGDWVYLIRPFMPPNFLSSCSAAHDLDICRDCLSRHLETQLESRGRACVESLPCPHPECDHIYTKEELRKILNPETFARYNRLCVLSNLATLPNFRWCLAEGCGFGQEHVFPTPALPSFPADLKLTRRNRVVCDACGFAMCFAHQSPWHEGRDCIEYGSERLQLAASQAWLRENTKACPGCGASIEKQGGCFHMTCLLCDHEFCWLCLADWSGIEEENPEDYAANYRRSGHAIGCYFRGEDAPDARELVGQTLEQAVIEY